MHKWSGKTFLAVIAVGLLAIAINAQIGRPASRQREDVPDLLRETLAKQRIAQQKKDHEELLAKGEEVHRLASELVANSDASLDTAEQRKRLERLEKAIRKIRGELGAEMDDSDEEEPLPRGPRETFVAIRENAVRLTDEMKRSSRHSLSVGSIQSSNTIWRLVRSLRTKR
jgi:hypothetical protein